MTITQNPIRTTIFYGLICALSLFPANIVLSNMFAESTATRMILWLFMAGYAVLMSRWSGKPILTGVFPLLFLFLTIFMVDSVAAIFLLALVVISWIRSGICFRNYAMIRLAVELLICVVAGALLAIFIADSVAFRALEVWMFFLIQSLYFVIFDSRVMKSENPDAADVFEQASRQAEAVLAKLE